MQQSEKDQQQSVGHHSGHDGTSGKTLQCHQQRQRDVAIAGAERDDAAGTGGGAASGIACPEKEFTRERHGEQRFPTGRKNGLKFDDGDESERDGAGGFGDNFQRFQEFLAEFRQAMAKSYSRGEWERDGRAEDEENGQDAEFQRGGFDEKGQTEQAYEWSQHRAEERKNGGQSPGEREIAFGHFGEDGHDGRERRGGEQQHGYRDVRGDLKQPRESERHDRREDEVQRENPSEIAATQGNEHVAPRQAQTHGEQQATEGNHRQQPDRVIGVERHFSD